MAAMRTAILLATTLLAASSAAARPQSDELPRYGGVNLVNETPEQHDARMKWFREAKFGMFIHWGAYSTAAGEWNGKPVRGIGEWLLSNAQITPEDYAVLQQRFNPVKFDAKEWVRIAKDAGMKYIVIPAVKRETETGEFFLSLYFNTPLHQIDIRNITDPKNRCKLIYMFQAFRLIHRGGERKTAKGRTAVEERPRQKRNATIHD